MEGLFLDPPKITSSILKIISATSVAEDKASVLIFKGSTIPAFQASITFPLKIKCRLFLHSIDFNAMKQKRSAVKKVSRIIKFADEIVVNNHFLAGKLKQYFESKSWYKPNPNFSEKMLNPIELRNIQKIKEFEEKLGKEK